MYLVSMGQVTIRRWAVHATDSCSLLSLETPGCSTGSSSCVVLCRNPHLPLEAEGRSVELSHEVLVDGLQDLAGTYRRPGDGGVERQRAPRGEAATWSTG